jgi:hypothetical protein
VYLRTITRRNRDGSTVRYIQLAHNERDPQTGVPHARILYNLGRAESLDHAALARLLRSIRRFLRPDDVPAGAGAGAEGVTMRASRALGGVWVLDQLWQRVGLPAVLTRLLGRRQYRFPLERALFALVAHRALAPDSKLACERWVAEKAVIPALPQVPVHQLYRAMDFVGAAEAALQREVFFATSDLLNLEVDLLYFDTTSTHFELDDADDDQAEAVGWRKRGHSRSHRPDLPQIVIGLAVTRDGIPVRCWSWPGNTQDMTVVEEVKRDLVGWKLGRVITVVDIGFNSAENLRYLQRTGGHYIAGEKLRSGKADVEAVLAHAGRYQPLRAQLAIKEIVIGAGEGRRRYVLVRNAREAARDRKRRDATVRRLRAALQEARAKPTAEARTKADTALLTHPTYKRYLRTDAHGAPELDPEAVRAEARLDGKYLVRTSDDTLTAADVALGYRQLLDVEDAFRTLKHTLDLRPIYHRVADRIRAHVVLCWLALLLVRLIEQQTHERWASLRETLQQMHLVDWAGTDGRVVQQRTETTPAQQRILKALRVQEPPRIFSITPPGPAQAQTPAL